MLEFTQDEFNSLFVKKATDGVKTLSVISIENEFGSNIEITLSKSKTKELGLALLNIARD